MVEKLTISQLIAADKEIREEIERTLANDFSFMSYYLKNKPFVGARSAEEQEEHIKRNVQKLKDLDKRRNALNKAKVKANSETTLVVPCVPLFEDILAGKEPGTEEITIAEAINRKYRLNSRMKDDATIIDLVSKMVRQYAFDFQNKSTYDKKAVAEVDKELARKFPAESKNSWSQTQYDEARKNLLAETEVIRIDPYDIIKTDAINKYYNAIKKYISEIDTLLSQVNASTVVTVEY